MFRNLVRASTWLALLACTLAAPAFAGDPPQPVHRLDSVAISATRMETPVEKLASGVTVVTGEEIRRKQQRMVVDALEQVPGVDVRRSGGTGSNVSIFLRGADSDHTLVLIDGIEVNDPAAPSRVPFLNHLTTDDVERIEVLRGPQSTVWGSDAIGGVINIVTRSGEGPLSGALWAEGGSYSTWREGLSLSGSKGPLSFSLAGSHADVDSRSSMNAGDERDPYRNTSGSLRLGLDLGALDVDVVARHVDARTEFDHLGFFGIVERGSHTRAKQTLAKIEPRLSLFDGRWDQRLAVRYSRDDRDNEAFSREDITGELVAVEWRHDVRVYERNFISVGGQVEWEDGDFETFDAGSRTYSAYAQIRPEMGERFFGSAGVRYDDHSDFGGTLTWKAAAGMLVPETGTTIKGSYGKGFKVPSFNEFNVAAFAGNPNLDEERSEGFDFGIEQELFDHRVHLAATYFQNWIDNLILAVQQPPTMANPFPFLNMNVDEARTRGIESVIEVDAGRGVVVQGGYTYTKTEARGDPIGFLLVKGNTLLRRPAHKGYLDIVYRFLGGRGDATLSLIWIGGRTDFDQQVFPSQRERLDDYPVVRLTSSLRVNDHVRLFGRVENAFDKGYEDVLGFWSPGLSAFAGLELAY